MNEQNSITKSSFGYQWGLPLMISCLAFTYELSLQKRLGKEITSKSYYRCFAAAAVGFIFTKYFFTSIEYHKKHDHIKNEEEMIKKLKADGQLI